MQGPPINTNAAKPAGITPQRSNSQLLWWCGPVLVAIVYALAGTGGEKYEHLHLVIDVSNGLLSLLLALFLLAEQHRIAPHVRKYLAIAFGAAAFTEILHALVGIEWTGFMLWVNTYAGVIRPATWPPSAYVLPMALIATLRLSQRTTPIPARRFAMAVLMLALVLYLLSFNLPKYMDTGFLGIQRPTQFPLLFVLAWMIWSYWQQRHQHPLFEGIALMGVLLFVSDLCMLYSTSPHEKFTMMAHSAKLVAYVLLHAVMMRVAAEDSRLRASAEEALKQEGSRLRDALNELKYQKYALDQHAIVGTADVQGNITYANDLFVQISGYTREELLGGNHRILNSGHHPTAYFKEMYQTIAAGKVWQGEICNRAKDGHLYWVKTTIVPYLNALGKPTQYISIRSDISAGKAAEALLIEAKEQAEAASQSKSSFLANMSHEIRTPMNAVLGLLTLLQSSDLTDRQRDYVTKTEGAAQSLLSLLNDILDYSKVEAGKMTLECEPFAIDKLLRNLSVILSANVGAKNIEVLFDIDSALPAVVRGDALRLQQVLINLGGNAVKFTSEGQVVIRVSQRARNGQQVTLDFAVQDTGIGIAEEHQAQIFNVFSQAEDSTTRRFGGSGLGLAISKRFVEMMGARIRLESAVGKGSTFSFTLELDAVDAAPPDAVLANPSDVARQRALVVDDHPLAADLTRHMVQSWGWSADIARSGQEALDHMARELTGAPAGTAPYSVVFLDWKLPEMDGWETTRRLRAWAQANDRPVPTIIMTTAHSRELLMQRTEEEQGMISGFLVKPFSASMLLEAVAQAGTGNSGIRKMAKGRSSHRQLAGMRILVVEDNLINQQVAEELLSAEGALVSLAANGQLGVDAVAAAAPQFDVVLMDVQMPVLDGYGATRAIREDLGLGELPIIAMTANAMAADREACIAAGMNDHIGKPFDVAKLVSQLIRATKFQSHASSETEGNPRVEQARPVPQVAGLDLATALSRMAGMQSLYVRTARDFASILQTAIPDLRRSLQAGDQQKTRMSLHTLKGNAGTLGASELAKEAGQLEKLCGSASGMKECEESLGRFEVLILATQEKLKEATALLDTKGNAAIPVVNVSTVVSPAAVEALQRIAALSQASDMEVLQAFATDRALISEFPAESVDRLDAALQDLDLERASTHSHEMLKRLA